MPINTDGKYQHCTEYEGELTQVEIEKLVRDAILKKLTGSFAEKQVKCQVWLTPGSKHLNYKMTVQHGKIPDEL